MEPDFSTPPDDLLQAVTPTSEWKRGLPRRIFYNDMPLSSPTPVIESTRYDTKSVLADGTGDQSSSVLDLDEVSLSMFDIDSARQKVLAVPPPMSAASAPHSQVPVAPLVPVGPPPPSAPKTTLTSKIPKLTQLSTKSNSSASSSRSKSPPEPNTASTTYVVSPAISNPPPAAELQPDISLADYLKPVEIPSGIDDSTLLADSTLKSDNEFLTGQPARQRTQAPFSLGSAYTLSKEKPPTPAYASLSGSGDSGELSSATVSKVASPAPANSQLCRSGDGGELSSGTVSKANSPSVNLMEFSSSTLSRIIPDLSKIDSLKPPQPENLQNSCGSLSRYLTPDPFDRSGAGEGSVGEVRSGGATFLESSRSLMSSSRSLNSQHSTSTSSVASLTSGTPSVLPEQTGSHTTSQAVTLSRDTNFSPTALNVLEGEPLRTSSRVSAVSAATNQPANQKSAAPSLVDASELAALSHMAVALQTAAISQTVTTLQTAASLQAATALQIAAVSRVVMAPSAIAAQTPQVSVMSTGTRVDRFTSREGSRNVSPIPLDELDSQSESGWSMVSELSDASKPVYSDAELKAFIAGDAFKHLTLNRQPTGSQPLPGNRVEVDPFNRTGSRCSNSTHVSVEDKPQAHSSRAASRDGLAGDSFFDLDESKFSKMSVLGQAEVEFNGLSHQGSRLFNEPSGLSINSIRELSSTVSPANTTDSRYGQIIKQTVTDRMFKLDSSDSPKESCPPTDTHASGDEASHHCSADSTLLQQATSAQPLREEGGDSALLQQSTSAHHLREGGGDSTLWQQSTSAQPLREEGGDSTLLQQATSTHHWREEGGDSTLLQQATSDQLLREEGGDVTSSPPSQWNRSWHSSAGRSDTTALPTDSTHTSRDTSAFKSFAKVADSSANTSHSSTLKNNSFAVEPSLHQSLPSKALAVSTANESIEQASLSSLGPVTPGHPICESSHIQRAGAVTPSDRSTHYLSMAEKSKPAASLLGSQRETSGPAKAVKEGVEDNAKQVNDWLRSHGDGYVTESDPVTMHLSNDSTAHPHVSRTNSVYEESLCKVSPVKSDLTSSPTPINAATDNANSTIMQTMLYQNEESTMPGFDSTLCQTRASPNSSRLPLEKLIEVESMLLVPGVHCTLTNTNIDLPVTNLTDRWLQVTAALWEHRINGRISAAEVLHFKQVDTRLKPAMKDVIPIWINAGVAGSHELLIRLLVIGEESQPVNMRVGIEVEKPIVELLDNRDGILDFGVVPYSCTKRVPLTLCNKSRVSTSLVIKVVKDDITRGEMNVEAGGPGLASPPVQDSTRLKVSLSSYEHLGKSHTQTLFVNFKSPVSHGKDGSPETVRGRIAVYQATAASNKPLLYVDTRCTCGHASVQVLAKYHNFEMRCGPQADTVERVALRNSGDVPIDVSISPSDTQHFSVSPDLLSLQPSQQGSYLLTFRTHNISDYLNSVHCKLTATIEPNGKKCAIDVKGTVDPPSAIPARLSSLVNSSQAGPLPAAGTKMKIKCAPQVLKFAGVPVDERKYITLKVLNHYEKSMKLNLDIDKSEFQICTLIDGVEQLRSSRELILPVSSSEKDTFHIRVCFEPRRVGFVKARLKVQSPDKTITFRVSIYGYGGQSVVEPALECSPSSGVYNLSAGDVHHKHLFTHQFYLRNVGHQKAFVLMQCFSGAECTERLELSRIQMVPASLVVSPADARKVTMNVRITEREKVLCERSKDVIASVKVTYVDQVLRTILQRLTAVHPQLRDNQIEPFLSTIPDDQKSDTIINMPDEAVNVNVFKQSLRSFVINVYADPKKPPAAVQRPLDVLQPNTSPQGLVVSTRSLTFSTSRPKETQELLVHLRNRSSLDIPMTFSSLGSPFKCKSKSSTLRAKNKGSLKLLFTAECLGTWNETFTITSPDKSVHIDLIGKCGASW